MFDHIVAEAVGEDLARQGWDGDTGRLALEDITKVLEIRVAPAHAAMPQLESGDVSAADDLVVGVHVAAHAVRARILNLERRALGAFGGGKEGEKEYGEGKEREENRWRQNGKERGGGFVLWMRAYLYLQKVLRRAVDLLEALLARLWHGLHGCGWEA